MRKGLSVFDVHKELNRYYDEHVRLGADRRRMLAEYRDACIQRIKDGLKKLSTERRQNYGAFIRVVNQGSYAMHTLNQHPDDDFDIDVAVIFPKDALPTTALEARRRVADALLATGGNFRQMPRARTNAVTVWYADGPHVDLAIYREAGTWHGAVGLEHAGSKWNARDPEEVRTWFADVIEKQSPKSGAVEGGQLRRIVRLVKAFTRSRRPWNLPGGMIVTALVAQVYEADEDRDDLALYKTLVRLRDRLRDGTNVYSPVGSEALLTSKPQISAQVKRLLEKLDEVLPRLDVLRGEDCTARQACQAWRCVFNHDFWTEVANEAVTLDTEPRESEAPAREEPSAGIGTALTFLSLLALGAWFLSWLFRKKQTAGKAEATLNPDGEPPFVT
jgi:hypothetical protein